MSHRVLRCARASIAAVTWLVASGCTRFNSTAPEAQTSNVWRPAPLTTWQWQLSGTPDLSFDVQMYDLDLFDTGEGVVSTLHAQGRKVVCYMSAGAWENWRPDADSFPSSVKGA